jgi:hypothetical protein
MKTRSTIFTVIVVFLISCNFKNTDNANSNSKLEENKSKVDTRKSDEYLFSIGFELMDKEKIGEIKRGTKLDKLIDLYGEPDERSEPIFSDVDGETYQGIEYNKKGISITCIMRSDSTREVAMIEIKEPCELKTSKNIGIGSTFEEVKNAYKGFINAADSDPETIIVGSVYGGLVFNFKNNKVTRVFIGPSAE